MLRRPAVVMSTAALAALLLAGCIDDSPSFEGAAEPAASLPPDVSELVPTDVGQFFVTPREDIDQTTLEQTVAKIKQTAGVQKAELQEDGRLNLEFSPGASPETRADVLKQAAALGTIDEGI